MVLVTHPIGGESQWASVQSWVGAERIIMLDTAVPWEAEYAGKHYVVLRKPSGAPYGPVKVEGVYDTDLDCGIGVDLRQAVPTGNMLVLDAVSLAEAEASEKTRQGDAYIPIWQWLSDGRDKDATHVIYGKEDLGFRLGLGLGARRGIAMTIPRLSKKVPRHGRGVAG